MDITTIGTITATIAGICMAICQVPQAWLVFKTKDTSGISILMQAILTLGIGSWFVTGILWNQAPMYLSNGFCFIFCLYILTMCLYNKAKNK